MDALIKEDLFDDYDIETIMLDMPEIFSGSVSVDWFKHFVQALDM